jgi:hypothetical protein
MMFTYNSSSSIRWNIMQNAHNSLLIYDRQLDCTYLHPAIQVINDHTCECICFEIRGNYDNETADFGCEFQHK